MIKLWHRHRMVQMRTRIMNQLQALAMNEGYRWKKKLFSEPGRAQLEKLTLAPWASQRRQGLLELLDRLNPTIPRLPGSHLQCPSDHPTANIGNGNLSAPGNNPCMAGVDDLRFERTTACASYSLFFS
jgi:transposase